MASSVWFLNGMRPFRERVRSEQKAVGGAEGDTECRWQGDKHRKEVEWVTMPGRSEWPRGADKV